jgi:hypothetical protein
MEPKDLSPFSHTKKERDIKHFGLHPDLVQSSSHHGTYFLSTIFMSCSHLILPLLCLRQTEINKKLLNLKSTLILMIHCTTDRGVQLIVHYSTGKTGPHTTVQINNF